MSLEKDRRENQPATDEPSSALKPGTPAPEFTLQSTPDQSVSLSDFHGQPVILAFYPVDWSPVCGDQMALYNEILPEFRRFHAELIGISVDGVTQLLSRTGSCTFPCSQTSSPKEQSPKCMGCIVVTMGRVNEAYLCLMQRRMIRWSYVSPVGINPGADGILTALEALQKEKTSQ